MSQAGTISAETASSTILETLTPNSGGAVSGVANNINVLGLAGNAGGNAYPVFTYNGGSGIFQIADNTFITAYVVDPSTTPGHEGTFQTVGAAVAQAVADGGAFILVRPAYYPETVTIPASAKISLFGAIPAGNFTQIATSGPVITNIVVGSGSITTLYNINFSASSGTAVINVAGNLYCENCFFGSQNVSFDTTTSGSGTTQMYNCQTGTMTIGGTSTVNFYRSFCVGVNQVFLTQSAAFNAYSSYFNQIILANSCAALCNNCNFTGTVSGSSSARQNFFYNAFQTGSTTPNNPTANITSFGNISTTGTVYGANPSVTTLTSA